MTIVFKQVQTISLRIPKPEASTLTTVGSYGPMDARSPAPGTKAPEHQDKQKINYLRNLFNFRKHIGTQLVNIGLAKSSRC